MSTTENENRAWRAAATLTHYKESHLGESGPTSDEDLIDLLADLYHMAGEKALEKAIEMAKNHYQEELFDAEEVKP